MYTQHRQICGKEELKRNLEPPSISMNSVSNMSYVDESYSYSEIPQELISAAHRSQIPADSFDDTIEQQMPEYQGDDGKTNLVEASQILDKS